VSEAADDTVSEQLREPIRVDIDSDIHVGLLLLGDGLHDVVADQQVTRNQRRRVLGEM